MQVTCSNLVPDLHAILHVAYPAQPLYFVGKFVVIKDQEHKIDIENMVLDALGGGRYNRRPNNATG